MTGYVKPENTWGYAIMMEVELWLYAPTKLNSDGYENVLESGLIQLYDNAPYHKSPITHQSSWSSNENISSSLHVVNFKH